MVPVMGKTVAPSVGERPLVRKKGLSENSRKNSTRGRVKLRNLDSIPPDPYCSCLGFGNPCEYLNFGGSPGVGFREFSWTLKRKGRLWF